MYSTTMTGFSLFTFGTSREGACSRLGAYSRQDAYFFFEKQPIAQNKTLIRYLLKKEQ